VLSQTKEGLFLDIGVEKNALLRDKQHEIGERLTLQVVKADGQIEVQVASRLDVPDYWGYEVTVEPRSLRGAVERVKADLAIGTSRKGSELANVAVRVAERWKRASSILVVFGSPARACSRSRPTKAYA